MKNFLALLCAFFLFFSCDSDEDAQASELDGRAYRLSSVLVDVAVDIDGDGVFTQDILSEDLESSSTTNGDIVFNVFGCFGEIDYFIGFEKGVFRHPFNASSFINVSNTNDMIAQDFGCVISDFFEEFNYSFNDNVLSVFVGSEFAFDGTISGDQLIFNYSNNEDWVLLIDNYLDANNEIQEYNGGVTAIFTLE